MLPMKEVSRSLREAGHAVGQHNSVDPILNVGVLVADVKIARARRVLGDARKLQRDVAELGGVSLREGLDVLLGEFIVRCASLRQQDVVAPLVEVLRLLDNLTIGLGLDLRRRGGVSRRCPPVTTPRPWDGAAVARAAVPRPDLGSAVVPPPAGAAVCDIAVPPRPSSSALSSERKSVYSRKERHCPDPDKAAVEFAVSRRIRKVPAVDIRRTDFD